MERLPDEALLQELRDLAETIDIESLKALNFGIGLGSLKSSIGEAKGANEAIRKHPEASYKPPNSLKACSIEEVQNFSNNSESLLTKRARSNRSYQARSPKGKAPNLKKSKNHREPLLLVILRSFAVHCIDLCVVTMSILLSFFFLGILMDPRKFSTDLSLLIEWLPFKFLISTGTIELLALLYAVYFVYLVLFRIFLGKTFGTYLYPSQKSHLPYETKSSL